MICSYNVVFITQASEMLRACIMAGSTSNLTKWRMHFGSRAARQTSNVWQGLVRDWTLIISCRYQSVLTPYRYRAIQCPTPT